MATKYVYFINNASFILMTPEQAQILLDASDSNNYSGEKSTINYNILE